MRTRKHSGALAIAAALLSLALFACDNSYGVFHEIQTEKEQIGTDRFKNATVKALGEDGINYYAVMSKVYYRAFAASSWTLLSVNGVSDYYAAGFASDGSGKIWVASMDKAGTSLYGVYGSADGGSTWSSALDVSALGLGATVSLDALYWATDSLFALVHDQSAGTYSLYRSDGSAAFAAVAGYAGASFPVIGMVKASSAYWALTQGRVYKGTSSTSFAADATTSTPTGTILTSSSGSVLGGIAADHSGAVLVTRSDGLLYSLASGGSAWTSATVLDSVKLGVLAEIPTTKGGSEYRIAVAKHNSTYGYCEWNAASSAYVAGDGTGAVFSPTSSGYNTTVYSKPVEAFHYSPANGTILIALASQGTDTYALYSDSYSGSAWSGWTAE